MAGFMSSSTWLKVALITLCLASVLFVVAFATVAWMSYSNRIPEWDYGLWNARICLNQMCSETEISSGWLSGHGIKDWYRAAQVLECLGLICMLVSLLIMFIFVFMESGRRRNTLIAIIVLIFAAVAFVVIGISVFATKFEARGASVGWSMGLAIASSIFAFIAGIMCILELKK